MTTLPCSVPDIVDVTPVRGAAADPARPPRILIECPHGATRTHHFETWRARMKSPLPVGLEAFFHVNTDVGSYAVGRAIAEHLVARQPELSVLLVRSLLPRTLVDVNRTVSAVATDLTAGGLTAALPPYITDARDVRLLLEAHRAYTNVARAAWRLVVGQGGYGLIPHTYGPVSLGISQVDDQIVENLRAAHVPEVYATWPVRAEIDLITRDPSGRGLSLPGIEQELVDGYAAVGLQAVVGGNYSLHPSTMGAVWSAAWPGRSLCFEVRRDLLVPEWTWNREMFPEPRRVQRAARPVAEVLASRLAALGNERPPAA